MLVCVFCLFGLHKMNSQGGCTPFFILGIANGLWAWAKAHKSKFRVLSDLLNSTNPSPKPETTVT
ncbi:hypothetical protein Hanom_Chr16g01457661 [Helianthus anomalus]